MNENTVVSVQCYAGDEHRVRHAMPLYLHHQCPLVILSPEDAPASFPGFRGGLSGYIGQSSLDRQRILLEKLLTVPGEFFLLNDSDSFCISPEIPRHLYESPRTVWSNEVFETRPHVSPYPKIAMQAPYFMDRESLTRLVEVMPRIPAHPITPYIDWFMLAATCEAGLAHRPLDWYFFRHPIKDPEEVSKFIRA